MRKSILFKIISNYVISFILIIIAAYDFQIDTKISNILFIVSLVNLLRATVLVIILLNRHKKISA
jgi:hypothetical protein